MHKALFSGFLRENQSVVCEFLNGWHGKLDEMGLLLLLAWIGTV